MDFTPSSVDGNALASPAVAGLGEGRIIMNCSRTVALLGGLALAVGVVMAPHAAQARDWVGVGIGAPFYWRPPPFYWGPPPVYYAPQPIPAVSSYIAPPHENYYYCSNPQGDYPTVPSCSVPWQEVPNAPPAGAR
jgi:hypothetical protein